MKEQIAAMILEGIAFLIPIITLFVKIGRYSERIDSLEKRLDKFDSIDNRLSQIEAKVDLLIKGQIKNEK